MKLTFLAGEARRWKGWHVRRKAAISHLWRIVVNRGRLLSVTDEGMAGWAFTGVGTVIAAVFARSLLDFDSTPGADVIFHQVRSEHAFNLLKIGQLDGWMHDYFNGYEAFLFNSNGLPLISSFISLLSFEAISPPAATLIVAFLSFISFPSAVFYLARSFEMSRLAAGVAAALSPLVSHYLGFGIYGVFGFGLLAHQVAAPLWALTLGLLTRSTKSDDKTTKLEAACAATVLCLVSPLTAFIAGFHFLSLILILLTFNHINLGTLIRRVLLTSIMTVLSSATWWLPAVMHRDLIGVETFGNARSIMERSMEVFSGSTGLPRGLLAVTLIATIILALPKVKVNNRVVIASFGLFVLIVGHMLRFSSWSSFMLLGKLSDRALTHGLVLLLFPLAAVSAWLGQTIHRRTGASGIVPVLGVFSLLLLASPYFNYGSSQTPQPTEDIEMVAGFLASEAEEGSRFGVVEYFEMRAVSGVPSPSLWLSKESGVPVATGLGVELTNTLIAADLVTGVDGTYDNAQRLADVGVKYLVAVSGRDVDLANSDYYEKELDTGRISLWSISSNYLIEDRPILLGSSPLHQKYKYDISNQQAGPITLPIGYSPKWQARDEDDRRIDLTRSDDGFIQIMGKDKPSDINLTFKPDIYDRNGYIISLLGFSVSIIFGPILKCYRALLIWVGSSGFG